MPELLLHQSDTLFHMRVCGQVFRQVIVDSHLVHQEQGRSHQCQEKAQEYFPFPHQEIRCFIHTVKKPPDYLFCKRDYALFLTAHFIPITILINRC